MVNLRSIDVSYCKKLDCSRALELLASWDWAILLESLNIGETNAEGQLKYSWSRPSFQLLTRTLTPKSCCAPPPPSPGSLDPLAKCTKLETLNLYYCKALTGTSSLVGPENDCSCI